MHLADRRPTDSEREAVEQALDRATTVDGAAPLSEQAVRALRGHGDGRHVLALDGETVVGYAVVEAATDSAPQIAEVVVHPDHRGRGVGTRLVDHVLDVPAARVWAHGLLPAAQRVAERLDLTVARELLQMRRPSTEPLPDLTVPAGVSVRTYRPGDDAEILRVNNAAFSWHPEQGGWTQADIDERTAESWFDPAGLFVATPADDDTRLLGFHWTKVHPPAGSDPALGEVYVVGIDPAEQGRGLGRVLTLAGVRHLVDAGLPAVLLYVEADNAAAVHTYDRLGFTRFHTDTAFARR
ncbi:mycothiol synthase [Rhodococcoides corynebacterioides]|uniref:mycothiol synthase n=1 Tax=Rhodococcoides corynebacterioides TaxID=53972 RepID=UPI0027E1D413|nr:mycothiol synthase [Rhodococcus corynebacterioides]